MTTIRLRFFLVLFPLFFGFLAFGQFNNECSTATLIADPENFCSAVGAGTTVGATTSNVPASACFGANGQDVWYSFVAVASEVTVIIRGLTFDNPGGTLLLPTVSLYSGPCTSLAELDCTSDLFFSNIVELSSSGLTPGETYYFRVAGGVGGTFQYCIRNYFFSGTLSGDCPTAVVLCDKSPFNVEAVTGAGNNPTELDDAPCFNGFDSETNSTWYVFTAANNGTLTFTLTPNNATDDLDFVVYRLPNGPGNCANKSLLRCMAAGDVFFPSPCMGPTGLSIGSTDVSEESNCDGSQDNFLAPLNMVAGTTYALAVNNFTSSGNGFQIEWGGTGLFKGPEAGFISSEPDSTVCLGETITFTDNSTIVGGTITGWHWNFGVDAEPATAETPGPHTVNYTTVGTKIVSLQIETSTGCDVTVTRTFLVETCCDLSAGFISDNTNNTLCISDVVVFTDTSTTDNGTITAWHWDFGAGAQPATADTPGPHTVQYATTGSKTISLRVETSTGCTMTTTQTLLVETCCGLFAGFMSNNADSVVCLNKPVVFTDTSTVNAGTITAWNWDFGDGATPATANTAGPQTVQYATEGNKIISLRIETSTGCDTTITQILSVEKCCQLVANFVSTNGDSTSCLYAAIKFTDASLFADDPIISWHWDFGAAIPIDTANTQGPHTVLYSTAGSTTISLQVETATGCTAMVTKQIQIDLCCGIQDVSVEMPSNCAEPCSTANIVIVPTYTFPELTFAWSSGQTTPLVTDLVPGDYIVTVTDVLFGCTDTVSFRIEEQELFEIPNAFTPNGDNVNDVFFPVGAGFDVLELEVYSRWGKKVWSGTNGGWDGRLDGKELPSDVYAYRSKVRFKGVVEERHGEVMLLR